MTFFPDKRSEFTLSWDVRIANLAKVTGFPKALFIAEDGRVVGTWKTLSITARLW